MKIEVNGFEILLIGVMFESSFPAAGKRTRQTDILLTGKKVTTDLFVILMRERYMSMYIQDCQLVKTM